MLCFSPDFFFVFLFFSLFCIVALMQSRWLGAIDQSALTSCCGRAMSV